MAQRKERKCWKAQKTGSILPPLFTLFFSLIPLRLGSETGWLLGQTGGTTAGRCHSASWHQQLCRVTTKLCRGRVRRGSCGCVCWCTLSYITIKTDPRTRQLSLSCVLLYEACLASYLSAGLMTSDAELNSTQHPHSPSSSQPRAWQRNWLNEIFQEKIKTKTKWVVMPQCTQ